jgi:hypothetical protein
MRELEILSKIEMRDTGKRQVPMRPLNAMIIKEVDTFGGPMDVDMLYRHELRLGCNTVINNSMKQDPNWLQHNEMKVKRMFAECLYKEVVDDLHDILVYSYEHYGDRELEDMIGTLINKMRP